MDTDPGGHPPGTLLSAAHATLWVVGQLLSSLKASTWGWPVWGGAGDGMGGVKEKAGASQR